MVLCAGRQHNASLLKSSQPLAGVPLVVRTGVGNPSMQLAPYWRYFESARFLTSPLQKYESASR
ncbi:hypothetical protein [Nostoc sp. 106C]|uniref:hypothetical protein n=1 Tax=Nostoc sp. 106C TaxID=1932667 RepID=UPI0030DA3477